MRLYEFEAKRLLSKAGIKVPKEEVVSSSLKVGKIASCSLPVMAKAQVLWGKRGKAGGILSCRTKESLQGAIENLLQKKLFGEGVKKVLVEEKLEIEKETYLSITYQDRRPVIIASCQGGIDIEEIGRIHPERVFIQPMNITRRLDKKSCKEVIKKAGFGKNESEAVSTILFKLYHFFLKNNCLLCEINPLIKTKKGGWYAADAKIEIDDESVYRLRHLHLPDRLGSGREPTRLELLARKNDLLDTRGAAGRMFYQIEDGNIVILAAGGGTSIEALDSLYLLGGRPAIFTEYSGNPTGKKVKGLSKIALMYPGEINAIWVIGGRANFTDIYETLVNGVLSAIKEEKNFDKSIPIIIRRAGPRDKEAFEVFRKAREEGYNIFLRGTATSIDESARMVIYQANKHYMQRKKRKESNDFSR